GGNALRSTQLEDPRLRALDAVAEESALLLLRRLFFAFPAARRRDHRQCRSPSAAWNLRDRASVLRRRSLQLGVQVRIYRRVRRSLGARRVAGAGIQGSGAGTLALGGYEPALGASPCFPVGAGSSGVGRAGAS